MKKTVIYSSSVEHCMSLMRLGGWALCSTKKYRVKAITGKSKVKHTKARVEQFRKELAVIEKLILTDKSSLPVAISTQDRGWMTFPRKSLLPLIQKALLAYKEFLNPSGYISMAAN